MKVIFFDIDGTLSDLSGKFQPSAILALQRTQWCGNKIVICTGRNEGMLYSDLRSLGFDAFITSSGADVYVDGEYIYSKCLDEEILKEADILKLREKNIRFMSRDLTWTRQEGIDGMKSTFAANGVKGEMIASIEASMRVMEDYRQLHGIRKLVYNDIPETVEELQKKLGDYFFVEPSSFEDGEAHSGEITQNGVNKATGMKVLLDYYGLEQSDSVAFGDSENDIEMLRFAGTGVCMGNGRPVAKEAADFVTDDIHEDGIYNAMKKLGLL